MSNNHVFALVGKSGSGKTTLQYKMSRLLKVPTGITTRAEREGDIDGQYHYIQLNDLPHLISSGSIILLNIVYAGCVYAYDRKEFDEGHSIVVVDVIGLRQLQETFGFGNVTGIYVEAPTHKRRMRTSSRSSNSSAERELMDNIKFHNAYHLCQYKITNDRDIQSAYEELLGIVQEVLLERGIISEE